MKFSYCSGASSTRWSWSKACKTSLSWLLKGTRQTSVKTRQCSHWRTASYAIIITSAKLEVTRSGLSVCNSVCLSICRITAKVSSQFQWNLVLWFSLPIGRTTDSRSLFHFPHHCELRDFSTFISVSNTVTGRFSRYCGQHNILGAIRQTSGSKSRLIQKAGFEYWITFGWCLAMVCTLRAEFSYHKRIVVH